MLDLRLAVSETAFGTSPVKIPCPVHDDPTASMAVYADNVHCFGCGFHLNDWDEALALLLGISKDEARVVAPRYSAECVPQTTKRPSPRDPINIGHAKLYNRYLREVMPHRLAWFHNRGLTDATIDAEFLGHNGFSFVIPVYDSQRRLLTLRFRRDDAVLHDETKLAKYSGLKGRNGLYLYGEHWLHEFTQRWVIVTEGELDALRLWQTGLCAISATNGARQAPQIPRLLSELSVRVDRLFIATDQDGPGEEAARAIARAADEYGMRSVRLSWCEGKDITEHLQLRGKLDVMKGVWNGERFVYH